MALKVRKRFVKVRHDLDLPAGAAKYALGARSSRRQQDEWLLILVNNDFLTAGGQLQQFKETRFGMFDVYTSHMPIITWLRSQNQMNASLNRRRLPGGACDFLNKLGTPPKFPLCTMKPS